MKKKFLSSRKKVEKRLDFTEIKEVCNATNYVHKLLINDWKCLRVCKREKKTKKCRLREGRKFYSILDLGSTSVIAADVEAWGWWGCELSTGGDHIGGLSDSSFPTITDLMN